MAPVIATFDTLVSAGVESNRLIPLTAAPRTVSTDPKFNVLVLADTEPSGAAPVRPGTRMAVPTEVSTLTPAKTPVPVPGEVEPMVLLPTVGRPRKLGVDGVGVKDPVPAGTKPRNEVPGSVEPVTFIPTGVGFCVGVSDGVRGTSPAASCAPVINTLSALPGTVCCTGSVMRVNTGVDAVFGGLVVPVAAGEEECVSDVKGRRRPFSSCTCSTPLLVCGGWKLPLL